jgi:hypothetical protein
MMKRGWGGWKVLALGRLTVPPPVNLCLPCPRKWLVETTLTGKDEKLRYD